MHFYMETVVIIWAMYQEKLYQQNAECTVLQGNVLKMTEDMFGKRDM